MASHRLTRINELLKREIAGAMYHVMTDGDFDVAAVTVTHVATTADLRRARVYLSIRGDAETQRALLRRVRRARKAFQQAVSNHVVLKYNPYLHFDLDVSVQQGDHVLELIEQLGLEEEQEDEAERTEEEGPGP